MSDSNVHNHFPLPTAVVGGGAGPQVPPVRRGEPALTCAVHGGAVHHQVVGLVEDQIGPVVQALVFQVGHTDRKSVV